MQSPFNADELAAQRLAGGGPRGNGIQQFMPEQHRLFLAGLPYLFVAAVDEDGWPLATLLTGGPGFVQSPDPLTLRIAGLPQAGDPAAAALVPDREIGILGIDFSTRRRNRVNGRIASSGLARVRGDDAGAGAGAGAGDITIAVSQSFGNCPQYIQRRTLTTPKVDAAAAISYPVECFSHLDEAARSAIARADTFFVASRSRSGDSMAHGADISHRGGRPGFIRIDGDVLTIPDFRGNRYFNTLGNLIAEPRAALLFVDFDSGDLLQLQGTAEVEWNNAAREPFAGAERLWRFHVVRGWRRKAASPLLWSFVDYSRSTVGTGVW